MNILTEKAWSPYAAGVVIGLLQVPTFLLMDTALGASSSFVTVAAHIAAVVDPGVAGIKYFTSHMEGAKNWWQVAVVVGIGLGAFVSMKLSGAVREPISPVWVRAMGTSSLASRAPVVPGWLRFAAGSPHRRRLHFRPRHFRHGAAFRRFDGSSGCHVRGRHRYRDAVAPSLIARRIPCLFSKEF